ncbi:MAG: hypothetical protein ACRD1H_14005 [Vicinamibacterales bacterium]
MSDNQEAEPEPAADDPSLQMRSEVNAYASAILMKLLAIVNDLPASQQPSVAGLDSEIRQMLAFIDPTRTAWLEEQPPAPDLPPAAGSALNGSIATLLDRIDQLAGREGNAPGLREAFDALREQIQQHFLETAALVRPLQTEIAALTATVETLARRREHVVDLSGIAEERIRVSLWKVALVAGMTGGSLVAAVVAVIGLLA